MKPPKKKPYIFEDIQVDEAMALLIVSEGCYFDLWPAQDENYPWVFTQNDHQPVAALHVYVWQKNNRPVVRGHVIHHRDHNKLNAQLSNLESLPRSAHAKRHRDEHQKFSPRKREDFGGLYRPHAPGPVRELTLGEITRLLRRGKLSRSPSSSSRPPSDGNEQRQAEKKLMAALPRLVAEVDHLDSGRPIPRVTTRRRRSDIKLGLGKRAERRGCTPVEAALVRTLVKNEGAEDPAEAAAAELEIPLGILKKLKERPSVDLALSRWRDYGRLPTWGPRKDSAG